MNFFSHKIANPTGTTSSWDDWVEKFLAKTASDTKEKQDKDSCCDQVINNDNEDGANSYQKGESVDGKSDQSEGKLKDKEAHCDKEMGECNKSGNETTDHPDTANSDIGKARVEQNINNDPNYQKGESTKSDKVNGKNKKENTAENNKRTKTANGRGFKKIASLNKKEKLELFAHMTSQKTKSGTPAYPMAYVEAMVGLTFANMKDDEKEWFKKFWRTMYPDSYVEEMVADR